MCARRETEKEGGKEEGIPAYSGQKVIPPLYQ